MRDPYEVLGVGRGASKEVIRAAYKELAKKYHPDKFQQNPLSGLAEEKFKEINEAYDTLMNDRNSGNSGNYGYSNTENQNYSGSYGNNSNPEFSSARQLIQRGDFYNAKRVLAEIPNRNAEWNYLMGIVSANTGFYNDAFNYMRTATQMEPANMEYSNAFNSLTARSNGYQSRGMSYGRHSDDECCRLCSMLYCADCCCECSGGDLISCC